jgi:hypothetical protein
MKMMKDEDKKRPHSTLKYTRFQDMCPVIYSTVMLTVTFPTTRITSNVTNTTTITTPCPTPPSSQGGKRSRRDHEQDCLPEPPEAVDSNR